MINNLQKHFRITSFACGWLAVVALPPFNCLPALFFSFPLLLWLLHKSTSAKQAFSCGYFFGFSFFAFGLSWINRALLLDAASFGWLVPIAFLASGLFFGLFIAIPAALCWFFKTPVARYMSFSALLIIFEWIRSFFLTGFPWNLFGTALVFSDHLLQAASVGGIYLLSLLTILAAGAPFLWFVRRKILAFIIPILILSGLLVFGYFKINQHPYTPSDVTIRLVQPAIPQSLKWNPAVLEDNLNRHIKLSQLPGFNNIDFVIWSETAFPFAIEADSYHRSLLQYAIPPRGRLITGALRYQSLSSEQPRLYNSMFVLDSDNQISAYYDKSHLVPFGEYVPLQQYLPDWIRPITKMIGTFSAGNGFKVIKYAGLPSFGGLICYEVIFPHQVLAPNNKPQWLVNITNDGWYGDSAGPRQHLAAAKLRAVEEGITIVRAAGSGISALISPIGTIIDSLPLNQSGILDVKLPTELQFSTTYGRFGNTIPLSLCFLILALALYNSRLLKP